MEYYVCPQLYSGINPKKTRSEFLEIDMPQQSFANICKTSMILAVKKSIQKNVLAYGAGILLFFYPNGVHFLSRGTFLNNFGPVILKNEKLPIVHV